MRKYYEKYAEEDTKIYNSFYIEPNYVSPKMWILFSTYKIEFGRSQAHI